MMKFRLSICLFEAQSFLENTFGLLNTEGSIKPVEYSRVILNNEIYIKHSILRTQVNTVLYTDIKYTSDCLILVFIFHNFIGSIVYNEHLIWKFYKRSNRLTLYFLWEKQQNIILYCVSPYVTEDRKLKKYSKVFLFPE